MAPATIMPPTTPMAVPMVLPVDPGVRLSVIWVIDAWGTGVPPFRDRRRIDQQDIVSDSDRFTLDDPSIRQGNFHPLPRNQWTQLAPLEFDGPGLALRLAGGAGRRHDLARGDKAGGLACQGTADGTGRRHVGPLLRHDRQSGREQHAVSASEQVDFMG